MASDDQLLVATKGTLTLEVTVLELALRRLGREIEKALRAKFKLR